MKKNLLTAAALVGIMLVALPGPAAAALSHVATGPAPALPLAGSVAGGRPVELFFMSRYLMALHSLEKATYCFTPSGQVYVDPTGFSAAELAALPAGSRGTYTLAGRQLSVRWASGGQPESGNIEPQNRDVGLFLAVGPFSGQALVGAFEGGNSVSLGGGSTAVASDLTFRADGSYRRCGSSALGSGGGGTAPEPAAAPAAGC